MKKGTLITSSSLPAGDTEIHHHSMLRWAEFPYLPWVSPEATCSMDSTNSTSIKRGGGPFVRVGQVGNRSGGKFELGLRCEIRDR